MTGLGNHDSMEEWQAASLGCDLQDIFASSYRCHATSSAGAVTTFTEERKASKYSCLVTSHSFTPVAIESLGPMGGKTVVFLKELSQRVQQRTGTGYSNVLAK